MPSIVRGIDRRKDRIGAWWRAEKDEVHGDLLRTVEHIESMSEWRSKRDMDLYHMALYGDERAKKALMGYSRLDRQGDRLVFNLIKSVIDTAQSEIAGIQPKPTIMTTRATWSTRRRANNMELAIEGEYDRSGVYEIGPEAFLDAAKTGTTALKVYGCDGAPRIEKLYPGELMVDPVEGQFRDPRTIYQLKPMDKEVVVGMVEDEATKKKVRQAPTISGRAFPWLPTDTMLEQILVVEAWRLPDPEDDADEHPGRHVIAIEGADLLDEPWERHHFPIVPWRWQPESTGFYGRGIAQELKSIQVELNYVLMKIQDTMHLGSTMRYLVEGNQRVNVEQITNTPAEIVRYFGGIPPHPQVVNAVPTELFQHAEDLIRRGFEQTGVSLLSAMSRKPTGLNSGEAQRVNQDIESKRFIIKTRSYERWIGVDLAKRVVEEKTAIAKDGNEKPVRAEVRRSRGLIIRHIKWKDVSLDDDEYKMKVAPSSLLPSQPAGRTATVEQWFRSGWITRDQAMKLLDMPDLEEFRATELSPYDIVLMAIETMIEDGEYMHPEPVQDLQLSIGLATNAYQRFVVEGAPEDRTELLLRYIDDLQAYNEQAQAPQQPQAAPLPEQAGGATPSGLPAGTPGAPVASPQASPALPGMS